VLVFTHHPEQFIKSGDWAAVIAPSWLSFVERTGLEGKIWERRTLYENGLDVDVVVNPAEWLEGIAQSIPLDFVDMLRHGVKVLSDKDGYLARILTMPLPSAARFLKPRQAEFINAASDFWYHTLWSAKHLRRGELWWAKGGVDMHLKGHLLRMLEWHAHAQKGEGFGTWLHGRFMEEWVDPRALAQLPEVFAHYDRHDIARALLATMDLYAWLEAETSQQWGYTVPRAGEFQAAECAKALIR
jgi:aminoglycoside 6-adenylyltransferase